MRTCDLYTPRERRILLWALFAVGTSNYVDRNIVGVLLEDIKADFAVSDTLLGLLSGLSFATFYAVFGIPVARWADRGNRRHVISLSLLAWSVLTVMCGSAHSFWQLVAARFGVGVGEAGAIPPAQSLLADYYPPAERARAIGIYTASGSAGYAVGLIAGGLVAQHFGWRVAFLLVGCAGIVLTPVTYLIVKEPRESVSALALPIRRESLSSALRSLFAKTAYRNLVMALVVYFLMAYGAIAFLVSFIVRVHRLNVAQAGVIYGVISAVGGLLGSVAGGALVECLAKRDIAWFARAPACALLLTVPIYEMALASENIGFMALLLLLATVMLSAAVPAMFSAVHAVCGSKRRALAVAIALFFANLVGLGLGPLLTGALSDRFATALGNAEGLRLALMFIVPVLIPAGLLMLRTGTQLQMNLED